MVQPTQPAAVTATSTAAPRPSTATPPQASTPTPLQPTKPEPGTTTDACTDTTLVFNFDNPETVGARERESVYWRFDGAAYTFVEQSIGVYQMSRHPDPGSSLAVFSVVTDNNAPLNSATILVDMATGAFRILGADYADGPRFAWTWLPLAWLAWIDDQGQVYVGSTETQQSLDAPAKMTDIWFVAPDRFLTRDDAYQLWTFDRSDSIWYPALLPEENAKIDGRWFESAGVFEDSRHVFLFFQEYSAILDVDSGTVQIVSPFASATEYYTVTTGTEGDIFLPAQQIKGTPYWFLQNEGVFRKIAHTTYLPRSTTIAATELSYVSTGFVVDSRTGAVLGHEALGIPTELAIYNSYLSPDRTQLAVEVIEAIESLETNAPRVAQTWFYSFATGEPQLERVEEGAFGGWEEESAATLDAPLDCAQQEITIDLGASAKE